MGTKKILLEVDIVSATVMAGVNIIILVGAKKRSWWMLIIGAQAELELLISRGCLICLICFMVFCFALRQISKQYPNIAILTLPILLSNTP